jgi:hypothetical protein
MIRPFTRRAGRLLITVAVISAWLPLVGGCNRNEKSPWNAKILSVDENPRNGIAGFGPMRAEVVQYLCGLIAQCTAVRFVTEVGNDDIFVYRGRPRTLKTRWTGFQNLQVTCPDCTPGRVQLKRTEMDYVNILYLAKESA